MPSIGEIQICPISVQAGGIVGSVVAVGLLVGFVVGLLVGLAVGLVVGLVVGLTVAVAGGGDVFVGLATATEVAGVPGVPVKVLTSPGPKIVRSANPPKQMSAMAQTGSLGREMGDVLRG